METYQLWFLRFVMKTVFFENSKNVFLKWGENQYINKKMLIISVKYLIVWTSGFKAKLPLQPGYTPPFSLPFQGCYLCAVLLSIWVILIDMITAAGLFRNYELLFSYKSARNSCILGRIMKAVYVTSFFCSLALLLSLSGCFSPTGKSSIS